MKLRDLTVSEGLEAYRDTGMIPTSGACYYRNQNKDDCGCLVGALAVKQGFQLSRDYLGLSTDRNFFKFLGLRLKQAQSLTLGFDVGYDSDYDSDSDKYFAGNRAACRVGRIMRELAPALMTASEEERKVIIQAAIDNLPKRVK